MADEKKPEKPMLRGRTAPPLVKPEGMKLAQAPASSTKSAPTSIHISSDAGGGASRDVDLVVGSQYLVSPLNPRKLKHRGRTCVIVGFVPSSSADNDMAKGICADVRFLDNNRRGHVELSDLVPDEVTDRDSDTI